jgi:hypothetical protein
MQTTIFRAYYITRNGLERVYNEDGSDTFPDMGTAIDEAARAYRETGHRTEVHAIAVASDGRHLTNDIVWTADETFLERAERLADSFK